MGILIQDLRYGLRQLRCNPGFTAVAVITLALGIGANTAMFSVVNAVLLRPLPLPHPGQLVTLWERNLKEGYDQNAPAAGNYLDWRARNSVFTEMAAYDGFRQFNLTGTDRPERVPGAAASASLFPLLGVQPLVGRTFRPEEERPGSDRVVILSYNLWQERFSGDREVVRKAVKLDGRTCEVIGVMPPGFVFPGDTGTVGDLYTAPAAQLWMPLALDARTWAERSDHYLSVIARLKPEMTIERAGAEMNLIEQRLVKQYPSEFMGSDVKMIPLQAQVAGTLGPVLIVLLGAVAFVLLIGCANVANLLLARATSRQREMAVRAALGASRGRVVRQLVTESLILSLAGGVLGVLLAGWGIDLLKLVIPETFPRSEAIAIDRWVLGFTTLVAVSTGLIFGLAPAFQSSRTDLTESLKEGGRGSTEGAGRNRLRSLLVVAEVALALVLVVGAGLMAQSLIHLERVDPGFSPDRVLTMELSLPESKYAQGDQRKVFLQQVIDRLGRLPGVQAAAATTLLPLSGSNINFAIEIEGQLKVPGKYPSGEVRAVTPDYFRAMGIPLVEGRTFTAADTNESAHALIVSQGLLRHWLPNVDPIGKRVTLGWNGFTGQIVGVVRDVKEFSLNREAPEEVYLPYSQSNFWRAVALVMRTTSPDPTSLAAVARSEVLSVDNDQPVSKVRTMQQVMSGSVAQPRFRTLLLGLFAALALTLAVVGVYSVMSYSVTQRQHEIGVRMALGAERRDVLRLVVGQALVLTLIGVGIGLALALAATRFLASLLYGVRPTDPVTFFGVALLLGGVALFASYIPARRATKVDPMVALRYE